MRPLNTALAFLFLATGASAQVPGQRNSNINPVGMGNIPLVMLGAGRNGAATNMSTPNSAGNLNGNWYWNSYANRVYPYYFMGLGANAAANNVPSGPSYANPGAVGPTAEIAAPLVAPANGKTGAEWADARSSFASASAKVTQARTAVEELRARLKALGQSPRASLITTTASAEAAIQSAQTFMAAGNLEETLREIQRSNALSAQVLKEFGR